MATISSSPEKSSTATQPTKNGRQAQQADSYWHDSAPRKLKARHMDATPEEAWSAWQRQLDGRKTPRQPSFLNAKTPALLWGLSPALEADDVAAWWISLQDAIRVGSSTAEELLAGWLSESEDASLVYAYQCLAIAYRLPELAQQLPRQVWWDLCDRLLEVASTTEPASIDETSPAQQVLTDQLLAGELPLVLAYQFPEIVPLRKLRQGAATTLSEAILGLTDGEGVLRACHLTVLRPLLASWTRCATLGEEGKKGSLKKGCWSKDAQVQYEWLIRQAIRLSRADGTQVLSDESEREWSPELFAAALDLAGDDNDCAAADAVLPAGIVPDDADFDDDDLPDPVLNSDWAGLAVLSTEWAKNAPRLTLAYEGMTNRGELEVGRQLLISGTWELQLQCDGQEVRQLEEWEEQCWQSDDDCDFLEISIELSEGLRLERQLLLVREDEVLYLADHILSQDDREHQFQYRLSLPLAAGMRFVGEEETRDGLLCDERPRAAVFPLALPEWRTDPRVGQLTLADGKLSLTQQANGRHLCCPLFFDLRPRRIEKQRTWRQLTVAETLEIVPPGMAVGYRAQSGKDQWLFYRSLAEPGNRTLLGQNFSSEFYAGRFLTTGEVEEFIEIESSEED